MVHLNVGSIAEKIIIERAWPLAWLDLLPDGLKKIKPSQTTMYVNEDVEYLREKLSTRLKRLRLNGEISTEREAEFTRQINFLGILADQL